MDHFKKKNYSFLEILTGSDLSKRRLPYISLQGDEPGPVIWFTGCIHGDEVGGIVAIQEVLKYLDTVPLKKGTLHAFPMMNPMGFESMSRKVPMTEEDLNRSFPGDPNGTLAHRMAHIIFSTIIDTHPDLVIDLHNDWIKSIPYTVIDHFPGINFKDAYQKSRQYARKTGFLVIDEQEELKPNREELKKTLSGSLLRQHIPALTLELGEAYIVNEKMVEQGVASILNILREFNMIDDGKPPYVYPIPRPFKGRILHYTQKPASSTSGIIRFLVEAGEVVEKGQPVARIYNVFRDLQEELVAPYSSIILGHADSSVAVPGREVIAFAYIPQERDTERRS